MGIDYYLFSSNVDLPDLTNPHLQPRDETDILHAIDIRKALFLDEHTKLIYHHRAKTGQSLAADLQGAIVLTRRYGDGFGFDLGHINAILMSGGKPINSRDDEEKIKYWPVIPELQPEYREVKGGLFKDHINGMRRKIERAGSVFIKSAEKTQTLRHIITNITPDKETGQYILTYSNGTKMPIDEKREIFHSDTVEIITEQSASNRMAHEWRAFVINGQIDDMDWYYNCFTDNKRKDVPNDVIDKASQVATRAKSIGIHTFVLDIMRHKHLKYPKEHVLDTLELNGLASAGRCPGNSIFELADRG